MLSVHGTVKNRHETPGPRKKQGAKVANSWVPGSFQAGFAGFRGGANPASNWAEIFMPSQY